MSEVRERRWSWVVAFACCTINCLLYGVARLSGLLLVATVEALQVTRARAALPYSTSTAVRNLSGIFVGYLGQKFGIRKVVSAGCVLSALGAACCFFGSDITWITICWGGIFGMGCGLATCLLPLAINQHFGRNRGTASGISYSGSYIGSFAFPPLVVYLLEEYGLNGTFLVISATMLNGVAAAMLFRSPRQEAAECQSPLKFENPSESFFQRCFCCATLPEPDEGSELGHAAPCIYLIGFKSLCENSAIQRHSLPFRTESVDENVKNPIDRINHSPLKFSCGMDKNSSVKISQECSELGQTFYKPKIVKLWEVFIHYLFRKCYAVEKERDCSTKNVKLISFQNLECSPKSYECHAPIQSHWENQPNNMHCILNPLALKQLNKSEASNKCEVALCVPTKQNGLKTNPKTFNRDCDSSIPFDQHKNKFSQSIIENTHPCTKSSPPSSQDSDQLPRQSDESNSNSTIFKDICKCFFGWFRMLSDPMYVAITVTMSLHTFVVVCMVTIIEDFAKDIHVPCHQVHLVIMALSTADLVGALALGVIADRGYISREVFMCVCLLGTGVSAIAISFSTGLTMLLVLVSFYGLFETGVIITFPLLIAQFIREKKQPVALASSNVLSAPTVLCVPPLIGYFRDNIGCYSGVFYVLGLTSFISSFIWLAAPYLVRKFRNKNKQKFLNSF